MLAARKRNYKEAVNKQTNKQTKPPQKITRLDGESSGVVTNSLIVLANNKTIGVRVHSSAIEAVLGLCHDSVGIAIFVPIATAWIQLPLQYTAGSACPFITSL